MTNRITNKELERAIESLNKITGNNPIAWTKTNGKLKSNIGTYVLDQAYGGSRLDQIVSDGGAINVISSQGYTTKRNLLTEIHAIIQGIKISEGIEKDNKHSIIQGIRLGKRIEEGDMEAYIQGIKIGGSRN